ncbi:MAG: hypothetical protein AMXMBFR4_20860 [Candidatus Hydrogenedentota bacterium]
MRTIASGATAAERPSGGEIDSVARRMQKRGIIDRPRMYALNYGQFPLDDLLVPEW